MPTLPPYEYTGPLDCSVQPDTGCLKGKSVIVTGGASGIGKQIVHSFVSHGAYVTVGDTDNEGGSALAAELHGSVSFCKCDVRSWDEQLNLFKMALAESPKNSCDIVIANAGISKAFGDALWTLDDSTTEPACPDLSIVDVDLIGALYTFKLAVHYFRRQPDTDARDRCFVMTNSLGAYVDIPGSWEYTCAKYGLRGLMRTVRRSGWQQGVRINMICPSYVKTSLRDDERDGQLESSSFEWATAQDCAAAVLHIACNRQITGRSLNVVPRSIAGDGFLDATQDDLQHAPAYCQTLQALALSVSVTPWEVTPTQLGNDVRGGATDSN